MKKRKKGLAVLLLGLFLFLTACQSQGAKKDIQLVASFYPIYEFSKKIVGDEADVQLLVQAGTEVHGYEPSAKDVSRIQEASSFLYMDPNMEMWVPDLEKSGVLSADRTIQASKNLILLPGQEEDHDHDHGAEEHSHDLDPHLWLSPYRAKLLVASLRDQLKERYPDQAATFEKNAAAYLEELDQLDKSYQEKLAAYKGYTFLTQHTAFNYLAFDYQLQQESIVGLSTEEEPSLKRIQELADQVKETGLKRIYVESSSSNKLAQTLASEAGVELGQLHTLEGVPQKDMDQGATYISLMEENLEQLLAGFKDAAKPKASETVTEKTVANGYFEDKDIKDRTLSDWEGDWQSVYPYLESGQLDQVFDYKAKKKGDKTAQEYKDYYKIGYQTDVNQIKIKGNKVTFVTDKGEETYTYKAAGYKILTYEKGNRGVRFQFEAEEANAGRFKYLQFSDHQIAPTQSAHFHLYFGGESQEALWEELTNWPTYYPASLTGQEIAQEMVAH
ncbi:ZinT/AdcA family metal-binding protein [Streptococcus sp. NLN76]|uniref:metal ABC transporter solute-binding protein, Zn/Mn family n=1 Tax=Streptococcus sp. NLN76 TaxID=2822800 RepID=UPI0018AA4BA2|nr:ZinT/AdcA family metal-binding protein [Streptococcus sp. NLN76]MBF8969753.1 ZinT/AdcA family metal-binding protein [Streptococcus sp. NLN76]